MGEFGLSRHGVLRTAAALALTALLGACAQELSEPAPVEMRGAGLGGPAPSGLSPTQTVVVRPGQSLRGIAHQYHVSPKTIIAANHLAPPYKLAAGQKLTIPGGAAPAGTGIASTGPVGRQALAPLPGGAATPMAAAAPMPPAPASTIPPAATPSRATPDVIPLDGPPPPKSAGAPPPMASNNVPPSVALAPPMTSRPAAAPAPAASNGVPPSLAVAPPTTSRQAVMPPVMPAAPAAAAASGSSKEPSAAEEARAEASAPARTATASAAAPAPGLPHGPHFPWPVQGHVVAGYGVTVAGAHNDGINIAAAKGTPVTAVDGGIVAYAGNELRGYGNLILIKHPDGWISAYAHCEELTVKKGDPIRRGQTIAKVGATGGAGEPQLHFELRHDQHPVDPKEFLGPAPSASAAPSAPQG